MNPQNVPDANQPVVGSDPGIPAVTVVTPTQQSSAGATTPATPAPSVPGVTVQPTYAQPQPVVSPYQATAGPQAMPPSPSGQPTPVVGQMATQPLTSSPARRLKPLLTIVGVLAIVIIAGAVLFLVVLKHPITTKDISSAQQTAEAFNNDLYQATTAINSAQNAESTDSLNSNLSQANTKLTDAQKQFTLLEKSNVLSNGDVKKSFNALNTKWQSYLTFLRGALKDSQALTPVLIQFGNATAALSNSAPTSGAGLTSYLNSLKQTFDTASQQASGVKLTLPEDKELLSAFQADLQSCSQAIAKAQSDLARGSSSFVVEDDLFNVEDTQTKFETVANKVNDELNAKQNQLDPSTAYNNFVSALAKLSVTVKS